MWYNALISKGEVLLWPKGLIKQLNLRTKKTDDNNHVAHIKQVSVKWSSTVIKSTITIKNAN